MTSLSRIIRTARHAGVSPVRSLPLLRAWFKLVSVTAPYSIFTISKHDTSGKNGAKPINSDGIKPARKHG